MMSKNILICRVISLVLMTLLLNGCESNPPINCRQEKLELQETIEAQEGEINGLRRGNEAILGLLLETNGDLVKCREQLAEVAAEKKKAKKVKKEKECASKKPLDFRKGVEELKAMRKAKIEHMKTKAAEAEVPAK